MCQDNSAGAITPQRIQGFWARYGMNTFFTHIYRPIHGKIAIFQEVISYEMIDRYTISKEMFCFII